MSSIYYTQNEVYSWLYKVIIVGQQATVYRSIHRHEPNMSSKDVSFHEQPCAAFNFKRLFMNAHQTTFLFHVDDVKHTSSPCDYIHVDMKVTFFRAYSPIETYHECSATEYEFAVDQNKNVYLFALGFVKKIASNFDNPYSQYIGKTNFVWDVPYHLSSVYGAGVISMVPFMTSRTRAKRYFESKRSKGLTLSNGIDPLNTFEQYFEIVKKLNVHPFLKQNVLC